MSREFVVWFTAAIDDSRSPEDALNALVDRLGAVSTEDLGVSWDNVSWVEEEA